MTTIIKLLQEITSKNECINIGLGTSTEIGRKVVISKPDVDDIN